MALYDEAMVSIITIHLVAFLYCIKPDLSIENYVQSFSFSQRFLLTLSFNITLLTSSSVSYMFQCELHSIVYVPGLLQVDTTVLCPGNVEKE